MFFKNRQKRKEKFLKENATNKVALILDNQVVEILTCNERLCAILTSNPTVIGYPANAEGADVIKVGWYYKDGSFNPQ